MFDLTSSKLLILGIVALIVVGPKDLPVLLRTIGRYIGMIRRHANEFRAQFDEAMRDAELDQLKKEMEALKQDVTKSVDDAHSTVTRELAAVQNDVDAALGAPGSPGAMPEMGTLPEHMKAAAEPHDAASGQVNGSETGSAEQPTQAPVESAELPKLPATPHPGIQDMKSGA